MGKAGKLLLLVAGGATDAIGEGTVIRSNQGERFAHGFIITGLWGFSPVQNVWKVKRGKSGNTEADLQKHLYRNIVARKTRPYADTVVETGLFRRYYVIHPSFSLTSFPYFTSRLERLSTFF
jgi:hypothetical protein